MEIRVWKKEEVIERLQKSDKTVTRAIVAIYQYQTDDEKVAEMTKYNNGVGFNGCDAMIGTSFAQQIIKGRTLSYKQMAIARKIIIKYAGQLANIANIKEAQKVQEQKPKEINCDASDLDNGKCPYCGGVLYSGEVKTDNEGEIICWKVSCNCGAAGTIWND